MTYVSFSTDQHLAAKSVIDKVASVKTTFSASYSTAQKRDEAIATLDQVADQARLASVLLQSARVVEGAT